MPLEHIVKVGNLSITQYDAQTDTEATTKPRAKTRPERQGEENQSSCLFLRFALDKLHKNPHEWMTKRRLIFT